MIKLIFALVVFLSAISVKAHQPDISSLTLIEQQPGQWMLQLNASLTAFQYEVRNAYGEASYATPEEFNQLLLKHLREKITIRANGETVTLGNGRVQLGHAATVAFQLSGVPKHLDEVIIKNKGFENIHNSRAIFTIIKDGVDKSRFILNEANDYQIDLSLKNDQILLAETSSNDSMALVVVVMIVGSLGFFLIRRRLKKNSFQHSYIFPQS